MENDDGFRRVTRSRARAKKYLKLSEGAATHAQDSSKTVPVLEDSEVFRRIDRARRQVASSQFYASLKNTVKEGISSASHGDGSQSATVNQVVCYALGNFASCPDARDQLCVLDLLQRLLNAPVEIYDPCFTDQERRLLTASDKKVLEKFQDGRREVSSLTLFYMIHPPHELINNVLYANWAPDRLKNLVMITNNMSEIVSQMAGKDSDFEYMEKSIQVYKSLPIENSHECLKTFHSTVLYCFPSSNMESLSPSFWTGPELKGTQSLIDRFASHKI